MTTPETPDCTIVGQEKPPNEPIGFIPNRMRKGAVGFKPGNDHGLRHGLYSPRLPKGLAYPDKQAGLFRRHVEQAVLDAKGQITVLDAALIHSACEAVKLGYKNRVEMREAKHAGILTPDLSLRFDDGYRKCLDMRDRKLNQLFATGPQNAIDGLYVDLDPVEPKLTEGKQDAQIDGT